MTLVERETSFERVFRREGLLPLGIDAIFQMGLREALESVPYRRVLSWDIWIDSEEAFVIREPIDELGERAMRIVAQPALLERVVEEANRYLSFTLAGTPLVERDELPRRPLLGTRVNRCVSRVLH